MSLRPVDRPAGGAVLATHVSAVPTPPALAPPPPTPAPEGGLTTGVTSLAGPAFQQSLWAGVANAGWPSLGRAGDLTPSPGAAPPADALVALQVERGVRLSESLARTHGLDTEAAVRAAADPYLAYLAPRLGTPAYDALYDDALEARAGALDRVRAREAEREAGELARALGGERMAATLAPLRVRVPPGVQAIPVPQAFAERAEALADATVKVTALLADLTPGLGTAKALAEAATGRDDAGTGRALSGGERGLRAALAALPAAGALVRAGAGGAQAVAAVAARTGRSAAEVLEVVRALRVLGPDARALEAALAKRAAGRALTREEAALVRRASEKLAGLQAAKAPAAGRGAPAPGVAGAAGAGAATERALVAGASGAKPLATLAELGQRLEANASKAALAEREYQKAFADVLAVASRVGSAAGVGPGDAGKLAFAAYTLAKRGVVKLEGFLLEAKRLGAAVRELKALPADELARLEQTFERAKGAAAEVAASGRALGMNDDETGAFLRLWSEADAPLAVGELEAQMRAWAAQKQSGVPFGFESAEAFDAFRRQALEGLRKAKYAGAEPILQGSAVTGISFGKKIPFLAESDLDLALAGRELFERARKLGLPMRTNPLRIGPLTAKAIKELGLSGTHAALVEKADGRKVAFLLFKDSPAALQWSKNSIRFAGKADGT